MKLSAVLPIALFVTSLINASPVNANEQLETEFKIQVIEPGRPTGYRPYEALVESVKDVNVAAQISGMVTEKLINEGDRVSAGQVLLRIDNRAAKQMVAASEAQVKSAEAQLILARKNLKRSQELYEKGHINLAQLDQAEASKDAIYAELNALKAQAQAARTQEGFYTIKAPFAGIVDHVPVESGDMTMPGSPLVSLYNPNHLRVVAALPADLIHQVNQDARIDIPTLGLSGSGILTSEVQVLPGVDASTMTQTVRFYLPPDTAAIPGQFARALIPTQKNNTHDLGHIYIPSTALVRRAEMTGVYVLSDRELPLLRQVRVGQSTDGYLEILSGLDTGDKLILNPTIAARFTQ